MNRKRFSWVDLTFLSRLTFHASRITHRLSWRDGAAIVLLCLLTLTFYRQIALTNLLLSGVDAFTYFYPYRAYAAEVVRSGRLPLWNPYLVLGVPFLANPQAAVLYPLNLALCWLPAPVLVAWSVVIHVALAALFAYLYARIALRLFSLPAFLGACAFAFGGFLSGQVEHVNQLNVSAWFPLLSLLWELRHKSRWPALFGLGAVIGVGLLAGHAQSSYISLVGLGVYATLPDLLDAWRALRERTPWKTVLCGLVAHLAQLGFVCTLGLALAAVQLVPTLELSRWSIRAGGLSFRRVVAFSLKPLPRLLRYAFLPPWGRNLADVFGGDYFTEYLAYVGFFPLLLSVFAVFLWVVGDSTSLHEATSSAPRGSSDSRSESVSSARPVHSRRDPGQAKPGLLRLLVLAGLGVFLALGLYNPLYWVLYKVVPGFALFRVPARWLFLYAFGAAMLSGIGLQRIGNYLKRRLSPSHPSLSSPPSSSSLHNCVPPMIKSLLVAIALVELFAAAEALPFNHPTAPEAYSSLRTAPAHIRAAQSEETAPGRFLSMSDILFDSGDLDEIQHMFRDQLPEQAIYDYVVSAKRKEVIAPNLPLAWRLYAVDGYDGGVLPLARYILLQRLFLDEEKILTDGRLREGLKRIPPSRLLSLLGTRYVITDKVHDVWIDDVFYDLAFDAVLGRDVAQSLASSDLPQFTATGIGVVSYLEGGQTVLDGTSVAEVRLTTVRGNTETFLLRAGVDTAEGLYGGDVTHTQARVGHRWLQSERSPHTALEGNDYGTRWHWGTPSQIARSEVGALPFGGRVHVRGVTLIDGRDGSNVPLILSTDGRFRQVHSGDVKIYEVLDALPRAYVVHQVRVIADDEAALAAMAELSFDPGRTAILAAGHEIDESPSTEPSVTILTYAPEEIALQVSLHAPGYLVLSDTWYPGWQATVDGKPVVIGRANVHFRAVYLPEGTHTVHFTYRPAIFLVGLGISALTVLGGALVAIERSWRSANRKKLAH